MVATRENFTPKKPGRTYLFTGLMRCGNCGWPMYGTENATKDRRTGKTYAYNADPEWEVQLPNTLGRRTYADVVYPTGDALEVFELKVTSSWGPLARPAGHTERRQMSVRERLLGG